MGRLFGTDGVRGKAGEYPARRADGPAAGRGAGARAAPRRRAASGSSPAATRANRASWIERELAFGIGSQGGTLTSAGVIPTPAVAYLTPRMGYTAGVVISASHNPFEDNGIKVFSGAGEKFTETLEQQVEAIVADESWSVPAGDAGRRSSRSTTARSTSATCRRSCRRRCARTACASSIDCANGATTTVAPRLFQELGFDARCIGCEPDGRNINLRLRLDRAGAARADGRRGRLRPRHRLRRRRRSRDLRRRRRPRRRRRRGDADVREADEGARAG